MVALGRCPRDIYVHASSLGVCTFPIVSRNSCLEIRPKGVCYHECCTAVSYRVCAPRSSILLCHQRSSFLTFPRVYRCRRPLLFTVLRRHRLQLRQGHLRFVAEKNTLCNASLNGLSACCGEAEFQPGIGIVLLCMACGYLLFAHFFYGRGCLVRPCMFSVTQ